MPHDRWGLLLLFELALVFLPHNGEGEGAPPLVRRRRTGCAMFML